MRSRFRNITFGMSALVTAVGLSGTMSTGAFAHDGNHTYQADMQPLNKSDDSTTGSATVTSNGDGTFTVRTTGASPSQPHAQHLHIGGTNTCPDPSADKNKDGVINTTEGQPSYGPIMISLTTTGDTSKDSGLAVDRFPVADANGNLTYERTFKVPAGVTEEMMSKAVLVTHGVSELYGDKNKYDGDKKSDIPGSETLPLEATLPATCGKLTAAPVGSVGAGGGSTAGDSTNALMIGAGAAALAGSAGLLIMRKRITHSS